MPTLDVVNLENKKVGTVDLAEGVFGVDVNFPLVHQVIKAQLANRRQGTAKTKTKGEVRGGGKKPFRQKGTGNARQGSTRSPLQPGGGQNFGPQPRSYVQATPKEMMRGALRSALSDRVAAKRLLVVDAFNFQAPKTKVLGEILSKKFGVEKALLVDSENRGLELSGRNLKNVKVLRSEGVNVYDIVRYDWILVSKQAVKDVEARLAVAE
jgi:large subunit ribosomal protein L4